MSRGEVQSRPLRVAILGFGREGAAVLRFLKSSPQFRHAEIWILDKNPKITVPRGVFTQTGPVYLKKLDKFDFVFRSPGIPYNLPQLQKAIKSGVAVSSGTKLFFQELSCSPFARRHSPLVIGITGTKGKGTTATLLCEILRTARKKVFFAGNVGRPMLELLPQLHGLARTKRGPKRTKPALPKPIVILELSSFQLQDLEISPQIAVILDIFPDHQDSHKNLAEYYAAKANIARFQKPNDKIFFFADNKKSAWAAGQSPAKKFPVALHALNYVSNSRELENEIKRVTQIPGKHNLKNVLMAATVARSFDVPEKTILRVVKNFRGTEHRLELVRVIKIVHQSRRLFATIREPDSGTIRDVQFWNDSASTNPQTAAAAVKAFATSDKRQGNAKFYIRHVPRRNSLILIAGGKDKNLDYQPLAQALRSAREQVALVVLMGENRNKIAATILRQATSNKRHGIKIVFTKNLREAVNTSFSFAKRCVLNAKHWAVLFSPGAASFDMFRNYADRGEQFKAMVKKLK